MNRSEIPERMKARMSPQDRAWIEGKAWKTTRLEPGGDLVIADPYLFPQLQEQPGEKPPSREKLSKLEREEHQIFDSWLRLHGFSFRHSRTDKATRETVGAPDFSVYEKPVPGKKFPTGRCLCIEFKLPGGKLSKEQAAWAERYGAVVHVLDSAQAAIALVCREFGELPI
jgi:hypothetical protein